MAGNCQLSQKFSWRCPSNIAIVKYWGKRPNQIPSNSSLSMTLSKAFTEVELELVDRKSKDEIELDYFFEGKKNLQFEERIRTYLSSQSAYFPFLKDYGLRINSHNSFPHSAGIASSASAFGAIALALLDASEEISKEQNKSDFLKKASNLARLGSGSACRSMFPSFVLWGENKSIPGSSDEFAVEVPEIHTNFQQLQDAILVVESEPKKVSSSVGHSLMNDHPYAETRFIQANKRTSRLVKVLASGDFEAFIEITESESLTLHAMMLTSRDYYILMKPATLGIIERIVDFRKETDIPICFTLDAGPNVHLLYADTDKNKVNAFLNNDIRSYVKEIIFDKIGNGPEKLTT